MTDEMDKWIKALELSHNLPPNLIQFYDSSSVEKLDRKIEILTMVSEGKSIEEIPDFYSILELYPSDPAEMWD